MERERKEAKPVKIGPRVTAGETRRWGSASAARYSAVASTWLPRLFSLSPWRDLLYSMYLRLVSVARAAETDGGHVRGCQEPFLHAMRTIRITCTPRACKHTPCRESERESAQLSPSRAHAAG
jgi:hypothetical protein